MWSREDVEDLERWYERLKKRGILGEDNGSTSDRWCLRRHLVVINTG